jgi:hypothetical protein
MHMGLPLVKIPKGRRGRVIALAVAGCGLLVIVAASRHPVPAALLKSRAAFAPHAADARVRFEPGAEAQADALASFLDSAAQKVEAFHGGSFPDDFEVFVCATQASLNEFLALPPWAPIRGSALLGDVYIAPSAFDWEGLDTHRESLTHELAHLYMRQRLGTIAYLRNVPAWFHEALADLVASSGGEGISREEATQAILRGETFRPDTANALLRPRRPQSYGVPVPMLHAQSTMFLTFVRESDPAAFERFVAELQDERSFAAPFRRHFGAGVTEWWGRFVESLRQGA